MVVIFFSPFCLLLLLLCCSTQANTALLTKRDWIPNPFIYFTRKLMRHVAVLYALCIVQCACVLSEITLQYSILVWFYFMEKVCSFITSWILFYGEFIFYEDYLLLLPRPFGLASERETCIPFTFSLIAAFALNRAL